MHKNIIKCSMVSIIAIGILVVNIALLGELIIIFLRNLLIKEFQIETVTDFIVLVWAYLSIRLYMHGYFTKYISQSLWKVGRNTVGYKYFRALKKTMKPVYTTIVLMEIVFLLLGLHYIIN